MSRLLSVWLPVCLLAALSVSPLARAQVSVYGTGAVAGYSVKPDTSSTFSFKSNAPGFVVGGFYNFPIDSRVTVGVDLRLAESPGSKGGTAGAAALRIGVVPHHVPLRPYFEIGGGVISTSTNAELVNDQVRAGTYTNGAAMLAFGLDVRVTHSLDIRVLDLGAEAGGSTTNGATAHGSAGAAYADTGIVFHFGRP
jgi:hypothetical protein